MRVLCWNVHGCVGSDGRFHFVVSPTALNQFRVGYSRRDLRQSSLQNGGITVPGLPANSFA